MNELIFNKIINNGMQVTRRIKYTDFDSQQLSQVQEYYWNKQYLNVAETAIFLRCSSQTVYRLIRKGLVVKAASCIRKPYIIDIKESYVLINEYSDPDDVEEMIEEYIDDYEIEHGHKPEFISDIYKHPEKYLLKI